MINEKLTQRVREALAEVPKVKEKKMFRGITFMVNGKMCISVGDEEIMCRIDPEVFDEALEKNGARPMVHGERVMRGFVFVHQSAIARKKEFDYWLNLSLSFNKRAKSSKKEKLNHKSMKPNASKILLVCLLVWQSAMSQTLSDNNKRFVAFQQESFAITNVLLIDGKGTAPQTAMTIVVKSGKITDIGPSNKLSIPTGSPVIDAKGKTLIPGFVMLHEHIFYTKMFENEFNVVNMTNTFPRMYLAGGVTTMRTAGSVSPHTDLNINRMIKDGKMIGPKMDVTGPFIERASDFRIPQLPVLPNEQQAGATVDYWADQGSTSFKVYMHITKNDLTQVVQRAHAHAMKVTGHLCSVTYNEASEIGIDNLEHGFMASSDFVADKKNDMCDAFKQRSSLLALNKDDERMTNLMKALIQRGTTVTTTPAVFAPSTNYEMVLGGGESALHPDVQKELKTRYDRVVGKDSSARKLFEKELYWIKKFYDMGGKLVVGTDPTGAGRTIAGYSNLWSLEVLVKAGFTLPQAVMLCSLKGAEYLKRDKEVGSVEKGKAADFILIDGDLNSNVNNIRKIQWVFKDGVGYDSKTIFESVTGKVGLY